jgi:hypothetical protein
VTRVLELIALGLDNSAIARRGGVSTDHGPELATWGRAIDCTRRKAFSNNSHDIQRLFCDACDLMGVPWPQMNARTISVARRAAVALLDTIVAPKF